MHARNDASETYGSSENRQGGNIAGDMLMGAIAGAAGVWAMDQVDWYMYDREDPRARERTQSIRPNRMDPAHNIVGAVAEMVGRDRPEQPNAAGFAVHYALGIGPGALYGAYRDRVPGLGAGRGLVYGFGLFVAQDEIVNAAAGLSADLRKYPWQAHARGFIAHLVLGVVTDTILNVLKGAGRPLRYPDPVNRSRNSHRRPR